MKTRHIYLATFSLAFTSHVFAGVPTENNQELVTFKTNAYMIENASVWSPNGPGALSVDWQLTEQQWDKVFGRPPRARVGVGGIVDECVLGVCVKAGAQAGIEVEAYVLPYFEADLRPGTFDATVHYQPSVDYQFAGLGSDFITLKTDSGFTDTVEFDSTFVVKSPSFRVETGLNISTDLNLFAEACLLGCFVDETYNLASFDFKLPLLEIDTINSVGRIFSPPTNLVDLGSLLVDLIADPPDSIEELANTALYDDISAVLGRVSQGQWDSYKSQLENGSESDKQRLKDINEAESFIAKSPISLTFSNPYTEDKVGEYSNEIASAEFGGRIAEVKLDLDKVLGYAFGLPDGGKLSLNSIEGFEDVPVSAEVELFNIEAGPAIDLKTELTLAPELMVDITFSEGVLIKGEIGKQTRYVGTWENIPDIALIAPDPSQSVGLVSYDDIVTATPTFSVDAVLTNRTYLDVAAEIDIQGLRASVGIDGFGELDTGFVFDETFTSPSLAQVDIYNASFNTGKWASPTGDDRNIGTDRVREDSSLVPIQGASSNSETLTFDRSGEVVFQARSKTRQDDVALTDDRVQQFMTTSKLIAAEIKQRGYEEVAYSGAINARGEALNLSSITNSDGQVTNRPVRRVFDFENENVRRSVEESYKIDTGQHAQIMTDGQFKISSNSSGFFFVEQGGSLELGASNFYGSSSSSNSGVNNNFGLVNEKIFRIDGDVYMGADELSKGDANRYKITNTRSGQLSIGQTGKLKFDGTFESAGVMLNAGNLELTSKNNSSTGLFRNRYGGVLDLYGNLDISGDTWGLGKSLDNQGGLINVRNGAELNLFADSRNDAVRTTALNNTGEIIIEKGGQVELKSRISDSANSFVLQNNHIIDNSGFIINGAGHQIVNGRAGNDWSQYRDMKDPLAAARKLREASIASSLLINDEANATTAQGVKDTFAARNFFQSKAGEYVNNARTFVESVTSGFNTNYNNAVQASMAQKLNVDAARENFFNVAGQPFFGDFAYNLLIQQQDIYDDKLAAENSQKFVLNQFTSDFTRVYEDVFSADVRSAETSYGTQLANLAIAKANGAVVYAGIERQIEQDAARSGLGILVNRKDATLLNQGTLTNHSLLLNQAGADIYNDAGGKIDNVGGYIRNNGALVNQVGAKLTNSGVIDNGINDTRNTFGILDIAQLVNLGTLTNEGELANNDTFINYGLLDNQTTASASSPALILNSGIMSNLGQFNNNALVNNEAAAELNNHGKLVNNGTITNDGVFNNGQNPNNGKQLTDDDYVNTFSVSNVIADAVNFYRNKQTIKVSEQSIVKLQEQIEDSKARESLVKLTQIPLFDTGNPLFDNFLNLPFKALNETLRLAYDISTFAAEAETQLVRDAQTGLRNQQSNAISANRGLASVDVQTFVDANGNTVEGAPFINLAAISSVNTAELENNGTFNNRGLFNNVATISNNESGVIRNSGVLIVGKEGKIDNAGSLLVEQVSVDRTAANGEAFTSKQDGMLISNGTINNSGRVDVSAGSFINGTLKDSVAVINNSGDILLSGLAAGTVGDRGKIDLQEYRSATLINQGSINNESGGNIQIGTDNAFVLDNQLFAVNTLLNMGEIINNDGANIENYGALHNTGLIDNKLGSTFTNKGLINNTETGTIAFAESAELGGFVNNNGFITMEDDEVLTLTGSISGNGTFVGSTLIKGMLNDPAKARKEGKYTATVNPGNSPGLLTFDGDLVTENVNWVMEIWGTQRGIDYDGVDVFGDFTFAGGMQMTILALLDFDTLISQEFNFLSITGDLFNGAGDMLVDSFAFVDFSDAMADNWAGNWIRNIGGGWDLNFSFIADNTDLYKNLRIVAKVDVPEPASLLIFLSGFVALIWRARAKTKSV